MTQHLKGQGAEGGRHSCNSVSVFVGGLEENSEFPCPWGTGGDKASPSMPNVNDPIQNTECLGWWV